MGLYKRNKEENGYSRLQEQIQDWLQRLCYNRWTDFNVHDPGVTLADTLAYALYEIEYLFDSTFEKYLNIQPGKEEDYRKKGLLPKEEITSPAVVTPEDYQQLILNTVEEVQQCQVIPGPYNSYRINVRIDPLADPDLTVKEVEKIYHQHRNLCERLTKLNVETGTDIPGMDLRTEQGYAKSFYSLSHKKKERSFHKEYYSIRNHLPECYGVGERSPDTFSGENRYRNLQLTGYLLIYDYLLAATEQRLQEISSLLELSGTIPEEEERIISGKCPELLTDRDRNGHTGTEREEFLYRQKERYLDLLDSLYGEDSSCFFKGIKREEKFVRRADLIGRFPELNRKRFRGYNILDPEDHTGIVPELFRSIHGHHQEKFLPLADILARYHLQLLDDHSFFTRYKYKLHIRFIDERTFRELEEVPYQSVRYTDKLYEKLYLRMHILWHNILFESFLVYGSRLENYYILKEWGKGYILLFKIPRQEEWLVMGQFYEKELLIEVANQFCCFIRQLNFKTQNYYLVEHLLLDPECEKPEHPYTISVILPWWSKAVYGREKFEHILRERLPAHLEIHVRWLKVKPFYRFEQLYYAWRRALPTQDEKRIRELSGKLKMVLKEAF